MASPGLASADAASGPNGSTKIRGTVAACVVAYSSAPRATLRTLRVPAQAQVTASRSLRITIAKRVKIAGSASYRFANGKRVRIHGRSLTIGLRQLRVGHATFVRLAIPQPHHRKAMSMRLRIDALRCGVQLTTRRSGRSSLVTVRTPVAARGVTFTATRTLASPTQLTLITPTGLRTLALAGSGAKLHLAHRAGALRVGRRGNRIRVTGLSRQTTGITLRLVGRRLRGILTASVQPVIGGTQSVHTTIR